ncbi:cupin domain-containing protein [Shewanella sp. Choline-02u-19]|uniref:ribosomal protein uL16 3-hydroxylase n=1 Tax=unclassified Shewanella TaxID=196818 RepID=UPI000C32D182|nr:MULTISPECIES: cupin domain-containing protein [unclassified Shewanella]PKG59181.1 cupin domain-containing protein [Shewanella sp. GutDb-MelDb]PKH56835.1 cupin domain-containing protein [Shewanella sp. Bg11-22]PKI27632.1 cupin domain-containing protein [Shewanella sp. Choline-02u-19]
MQLDLNGITPKQFLEQYWQKKPLVIRQGFKNFKDLLSPEEMAGLACEDVVESRRVFKEHDEWQAEFGPFESYEELGETDWTLIVQALNNWVPEAEELIKCFDFIPRWRLDDVMVSYATPGGGVGPHIDLYDVFICQGSGRRRWRVGDLGPHKEFAAHPALLHTEAFDPIIDVELLPGDILYLPPGYPHDGVTIEPSMSFSVGYRTASAKDMISAMADHIIDKDMCNEQIADPDRVLSENSGVVNNGDLERIKQQLFATLDDKLVSEFSGRYLTQSKCELDLPEEHLGFQSLDVTEQLKQQPLIKLGGLRTLYFEASVADGVLYINGEQFTLSASREALIALLCDTQELTAVNLSPWLEDIEVVEQLTAWVNAGYWYFDDID